MKNLWSLFCFLIFVMLLFANGNQTCAQGNIHFGDVEVHPYVELEHRYNDNIFLAPDNEIVDWITTVTPGVSVGQQTEKRTLSLEYFADIIKYWEHSSESTEHHHLSLLADVKFARRMSLVFEEKFIKTDDPATSELTERQGRIRNNVSLVTGYGGEDLRIDVGYENIRDDYESMDHLDKSEDVYMVTGYHRILPKTFLLLDYNRGFITYDEDIKRNVDYNEAGVGIRGEWFPKTSGLFRAGYQWREYDNGDDFDGGVALLSSQWIPLERTYVNIFGRLGVSESTFGTNDYYRFKSLGSELVQGMGEKWSLLLSCSNSINKYPEEVTTATYTGRRKDTTWVMKVAGTYNIRVWLGIEFGYRHRTRESNFDEFDYDRNEYYANISATF